MTNDFELGMGIFSTTDTSDFDDYVDELLNNNISYLRVDIPDYQNAAWLARSKAAVIRAIAKGINIVWGVSSNKFNNAAYELTAANWSDYSDAVKLAAAWAEANGVYEFQLGNEEELHNDDTTLTDAQLRTNIKTLATEVQAIFNRGKISYSCHSGTYNSWIAEGKGDIDILAFNLYKGTDNNWMTFVDRLIAAFGVDGTYMTEFGLNSSSLDTYSTDENVQSWALEEVINYFKKTGIIRAYYFCYLSDTMGARKANGVYRKLWDVLKVQNDWKKRKIAGQKELRTDWDALTASDITKAVGHTQNLVPEKSFVSVRDTVGL